MNEATLRKIISEPKSKEAESFAAIATFRKLDSWKSSHDLWNKIVNNESFSAVTRRRALIQSFDLLKLESPFALSQLGKYFAPATWLLQENVFPDDMKIGRIPVQHNDEDRVFCIHFKFMKKDDSVVYLTVNKKISGAELCSAMHGEGDLKNGAITDVSVIPDLESDRNICHEKRYHYPGKLLGTRETGINEE